MGFKRNEPAFLFFGGFAIALSILRNVEKGGEIRFFKDGYADLRGGFDYVSPNTNEPDHAERFAILILSEDYGAVIREAAPPKR